MNNWACPSSLRPTLYVGKLDSHLYASIALVHQGVSLVVRISRLFIHVPADCCGCRVTGRLLSVATAASGTDAGSYRWSRNCWRDSPGSRRLWDHTVHWGALPTGDHQQPEKPLAVNRYALTCGKSVSCACCHSSSSRRTVQGWSKVLADSCHSNVSLSLCSWLISPYKPRMYFLNWPWYCNYILSISK